MQLSDLIVAKYNFVGRHNYMNNKLVVVIVSLLLLLTSCAVNPDIQDTTAPPERSYVSADITYSEPTAQYAFRLNMDTTETECLPGRAQQ